MSNVDPTLQFPSGLTVGQVKQAAKRLARDEGITHTQALDTLARVNGIDLHWAAAVAVLARAQASVPPAQRREPRRRGPQRAYVRGQPYEGARDAPRPAVRIRRGIDPETEQRVRRAVAEYFDGPQHMTTLAAKHDVPLRLLRYRIGRFRYDRKQEALSRWSERVEPVRPSASRTRDPIERS